MWYVYSRHTDNSVSSVHRLYASKKSPKDVPSVRIYPYETRQQAVNCVMMLATDHARDYPHDAVQINIGKV
jgi:hypothetical protein